jgi:hypothetical protein
MSAMVSRNWTIAIAVAAAWLAACSKDPSPSAAASAVATTSATAAPAFDVEGFCERVMALPKARGCKGDDEIIEGNKVGYCTTTLREAREASRVRFDAEAATACISAVEGSAELPDRRNLADLALAVASCRKVVVGKQAPGAECANTFGCLASSSCGAGHCKARVAEGATCTENDACPGGQRCRAGTCAAPTSQKDGARCEDARDCRHGSHCGGDHRCAADKKAGEICSGSDECLGRCSREKGSHCVSYCGSG